MNLVHCVTGYDKRSERLEKEFEIPPERVAEIRDLARVPPESYAVFPLDAATVRAISARLPFVMNIDQYDWFLEPYSRH